MGGGHAAPFGGGLMKEKPCACPQQNQDEQLFHGGVVGWGLGESKHEKSPADLRESIPQSTAMKRLAQIFPAWRFSIFRLKLVECCPASPVIMRVAASVFYPQ